MYLIEKTDFFVLIMANNIFPNKTVFECYMEIGWRLFKHQCQAINNVISMGHFNDKSTEFNDPICYETKALCLSTSMVNHSCSPNAVIV